MEANVQRGSVGRTLVRNSKDQVDAKHIQYIRTYSTENWAVSKATIKASSNTGLY